MKSGKCPKCGSENIYRSEPVSGVFAGGIYRLIGHWIGIKAGILGWKSASLVHFACDDCQYIESYVADKGSMKNIREEWIPNPKMSKRKIDE